MKRKNPFETFSAVDLNFFSLFVLVSFIQLWIYKHFFFVFYFLWSSKIDVALRHEKKIFKKIQWVKRKRGRKEGAESEWWCEEICQIWIHNPALDLIYFDGSVLMLIFVVKNDYTHRANWITSLKNPCVIKSLTMRKWGVQK